jgi:hypothetical protein
MNKPIMEKYGIGKYRLSGFPRVRFYTRWYYILAKLFLMAEIGAGIRLPLRTALKAWRRGHTRMTYVMYDLEHRDHREFLSARAQLMASPLINGPFDAVIASKGVFRELMESLRAPYPRFYGVIIRGRINLRVEEGGYRVHPDLEKLLEEGQRLVLKPVEGGKGIGVIFLGRHEGRLHLNGQEITPADLSDLIRELDDYLITEFIHQAEYSRVIFPDTTNTIRILTMWDYERMEPFIAQAAHRIGTSRSFPVDNFRYGRGGLSSSVDLQGGELGKAFRLTDDWRVEWHSRHPENGSQIEGVGLPLWSEIRGEILRMAAELPYIPYIAWDVVMTDGGFSILETNSTPGLAVLQVHEPLLRDPRVRRFYQAHKVIE